MAVRDGICVVLAGSPNTGKSSLLNALAGREAAIVSSRPGTTRDVVEVLLDLDGVPVVLRDTAGLRDESDDEIELIGMARTRAAAAEADAVVWVWSEDIGGSWQVDPGVIPSIRVRSKADLPRVKLDHIRNDLWGSESVAISAATGEGISAFVSALSGLVRSRVGGWERAVVSHGRQVEALNGSIRCLNDALGRDAERLELLVADLRRAAGFLGQITGHIDVEDWLDGIFSRFCIGK
jgi:tRNA modification GTPase